MIRSTMPTLPLLQRGRTAEDDPVPPERVDTADLEGFLEARVLLVEQHARAWLEILFDWEQRNEYSVSRSGGGHAGTIIEQGKGFGAALARVLLGSRRPVLATVFTPHRDPILDIARPFHFLFSDMRVENAAGEPLGRVRQRFGLLKRLYDLHDQEGRLFARIEGPLWHPYTFRILDVEGEHVATITKKWAGLSQEYFTDADNFRVDFGEVPWSLDERATIFAAAITIDFDYFENNNR